MHFLISTWFEPWEQGEKGNPITVLTVLSQEFNSLKPLKRFREKGEHLSPDGIVVNLRN
jgi:hypothetical protein